jgi:hypothetical protein
MIGGWPGKAGDADVGQLADEPAKAFRGLMVLTVVMVVLQSVLHLVDVGFDLQIDRLNADDDRSIWSWTGSAAELMAALGAGLMLVLPSVPRKPIIFLALVLAFFSIDDTVQVHEQLSHVLERFPRWTGLPPRMVWPILYSPVMLATCAMLWRISVAMVERCGRALRGGVVMLGFAVLLEFGVGAVSLDLGSGRFDTAGATSMGYACEVVAEEGLELAGWLLIAASLIATDLDLLIRQVRRRLDASDVTAGLPAGHASH